MVSLNPFCVLQNPLLNSESQSSYGENHKVPLCIISTPPSRNVESGGTAPHILNTDNKWISVSASCFSHNIPTEKGTLSTMDGV